MRRALEIEDRSPPRVARGVLAATIGAYLGAASVGAGAVRTDPGVELARVVVNSKLASSKIGISIVDGSTGAALASHNQDARFIPASNMKLLTSGVALLVLGDGYLFKTELLRDGDRLIVRGGGDPALGDPEVLKLNEPALTTDGLVAAFASAANKAGMSRAGEVVVDDRVFDRQWVHPTWNPQNLHRGYSAQVAGLNFHANVLTFYLRPNPQGEGAAPLFQLEPLAPWLPIANKGRTTGGNQATAWISRAPETNAFTIMGEVVTRGAPPVADATIHEPPTFFARVLAARLEESGVRVDRVAGGGEPAVRLAGEGEAWPGATPIFAVVTPMSTVLARCNTHSENLYAEALLKSIGHAMTRRPGSWEDGAATMRMVLGERLGPKFAGACAIADGSGLSRDNLVTPSLLTRWLQIMGASPVADAFVESLAQPGKPGTLEKRFRGVKLANELRAKSGYINGVRSLSGYLTDPATKQRVVFSVLLNDLQPSEQAAALELHEQVVRIADTWLERQAAPSPEPVKVGG